MRARRAFGTHDLARLREAVARDPESVEAHMRLGLALSKSGFLADAEQAFRRALEIDPSCAAAWVNLGGIAFSRCDFAGCVEANERALAIDADLVLAHYNLGLGYLYLAKPELVVECFRRVIELDENNAGGHYHLAVGLNALGRTAEARASLETAVGLGYSPSPDLLKALDRDGGARPGTLDIGPSQDGSR